MKNIRLLINKYLFSFFLTIAPLSLFAQETQCNCIDELDTAANLIQKAKSYKIQVKRAGKEAEFGQWREKIAQEISNDSLRKFFCVGYLQKYISFINDRHNELYTVPDEIAPNVPTYRGTIDTTQLPSDGISGVYHAGSDKILLKKENDSTWFGITMGSNSEEWPQGKIRLRINRTSEGELELFEFYSNGLLFYQKDVKIADGRIHSTFWNKGNNYFFNKNHQNNFTFRDVNPSLDYIGLKTLKRTKGLMNEAADFYERTLEKLVKPHLIIDLRNNGGGSVKQAAALLKSVKRNDAIKRIFVMINFKTASAAELTALQLKEDERTVLVGEPSRGMLAYGYGNRAFSTEMECSATKVVLSTKREHRKWSQYETVGIPPDLFLDNESPWIDQVLQAVESGI